MTISLPTRNTRELQELPGEWPEGKHTAMIQDVLVLAGKLHYVAYVVRPGRYFVRRLLQLSTLHLNRQEKREGQGVWGKSRKEAEATKVLRLTEEVMEAVEWWRWCLKDGMAVKGERLAAPFFTAVVKQTHEIHVFRTRRSLLLEGCACTRRCTGDTASRKRRRRGRLGAGRAETGIGCLSQF